MKPPKGLNWIKLDHTKKIYIPEGRIVYLFSEETGVIWTDFRYSSMPKSWSNKPSHYAEPKGRLEHTS